MRIFLILLITTFCLFQLNSNAQNFGVIGGVGFNNEKISQHVGLNMSIPLSKNIAIETGLAYSNKKSSVFIYKYDIGSQTLDLEQNVEAHYIEAPLLFKMGFDIGKFHLFGNVGPYFGYGITGKVKYNSSVWIWETRTYDYTQEINNKIDIGMNYGLGVAYNSFQLRTMYLDGLTNIVNSSKNKELRLSLVYMFKEKKKEVVQNNSSGKEDIKKVLKTLKTVEIGLISGVNFNKMKDYEYNPRANHIGRRSSSYTETIGKHLGIVFKTPISDNLSIQPSILYSTKEFAWGASYTAFTTGDTYSKEIEQNIKLSFIDIPINFNLNAPIGPLVAYFTFGPYISFGVSGTTKSFSEGIFNDGLEETVITNSYDGKIRWGESELEDKQFDYGINYGIGIEFKSFQLITRYNNYLGITDNRDYKNTLKNNVLQVSLAYFFLNKRKDKKKPD